MVCARDWPSEDQKNPSCILPTLAEIGSNSLHTQYDRPKPFDVFYELDAPADWTREEKPPEAELHPTNLPLPKHIATEN